MRQHLARWQLRIAIALAGAVLIAGVQAGDVEPSSKAADDIPGVPTEQLPPAQAADSLLPDPAADDGLRSGREIYDRFIEGLAQPECETDTSKGRWKQHFKHAPRQMAQSNTDLLPLFGYVVDALRDAGLPTEYALIPFVESGYKPGARSSSGPAGLWQFIGTTARNQGVTMQGGYDGRLSPVESTQAAVRYLKILHSMFGRDWRLATMGYNAGEYRVLQSMRRAGMNSSNARPAELPGLSRITYSYVEKLHAIACLLKQAEKNPAWLDSIDRQVPRLASQELKGASLDAWARSRGHDPALLQRLNPALANSAIRNLDKPLRILAPAGQGTALPDQSLAPLLLATPDPKGETASRQASTKQLTHTVRSGESAWVIAKRYGLSVNQLLKLNQLGPRTVLRPGMVLKLDTAGTE